MIERRHGVDAQKFQAGHAKVHARHSVVAQSIGTERASVTHTVAQNAPRVRQVFAIFPSHARHFQIMVWFGESNTERNPAYAVICPWLAHGAYPRKGPILPLRPTPKLHAKSPGPSLP